MPVTLKELLIVGLLAAVAFRVAKVIAPSFIPADDFARRRNTWFVLTVSRFSRRISGFMRSLRFRAMFIAGRKDSNPSALYILLLQVVPPVSVPVPNDRHGVLVQHQ